MQQELLQYLRCPVTREPLELQVIDYAEKEYRGEKCTIIWNGLLTAGVWCYPIINGIPRLLVEAFIDYADFLKKNLTDFDDRRNRIFREYEGLVRSVVKKNSHTKKSFEQEWGLFDYEKDNTWDANPEQMVERFLTEVDETPESIRGKLIFDAGCGNGLLDQLIARLGCRMLAMDFSRSIERAFEKNNEPGAWYVQGDVQFPPVSFEEFDITHCSGVAVCTNNVELTLSGLTPTIKPGGHMSIWLYHPRKDFLHNTFNVLRKITSRLPIRLQYYLYLIFLFPPVYAIKRWKGVKQNKRELMVDLLDWLSPEFRWEVTHDEAEAMLAKREFRNRKVTTNELFGFNIIGTKK